MSAVSASGGGGTLCRGGCALLGSGGGGPEGWLQMAVAVPAGRMDKVARELASCRGGNGSVRLTVQLQAGGSATLLAGRDFALDADLAARIERICGEGSVDLETGVITETTGPEVRTRALFRDTFIGAVRIGHPLSKGRITPARYAAGRHVLVSRSDAGKGLVDEALAPLGLERQIVSSVSGFAAALALARASDLIATVPTLHTANLRAGMHSFRLPIALPEITVSMLWHPRMDADPGHRWLRDCVRAVCAAA